MKFERTTTTLRAPGVELDVFVVPWDSEILGITVAQVERIEMTGEAKGDLAIAQLDSWLDAHDIRLASCRLASDRLRESMLLESTGFRFIEMVYRPTLGPIPPTSADQTIMVRAAEPGDLTALEAIASSAFSTGRFLLDWRLDARASERRYATWVRNSFADPRQEVLTAVLDGSIVGFFVVEALPDLSVYWHLTAIAPQFQGRGIGKRLWRSMVARHADAGRVRIDTTISAHNTPVMNIYAGLGFKFGAPQMTFHWVRP